MTKGIYSIRTNDGKRYIGSSTHIERRWGNHLSEMKRRKNGSNKNLKPYYLKHGVSAFIFEILEVVEKEKNLHLH